MYVYDGSAWGEVTSTGDYKFLTIKDHDQAVGGSGPTFNGSNEEFDLFDGSSDASINSAAQLLVVLNGVLQKPNSGTFSGSEEGFYLNDTHGIKFCDPPASGSTLFVTQIGSATTVNVPADGSVTAAKIGSGAVTTAKIGADAVDGTKIADDAINSEHYTDGSIDTAHIADDQVTLAKMAGLARGKIIYGDSSGNPAALTVGSANYVLKSDGTDVSWGEVAAGATGGSTNKIFWENGQTVTTNYTVGTTFGAACNALSAGPITINSGVTVTIDSGDFWTIV